MTRREMKILFFPFAGGSSYSYFPFLKTLKGKVTVIPIELPGRGKRIGEPLLTNTSDLIEDIFNHYAHLLSPPYAIFGHSMGALLGYLFAQKVIAEGMPSPVHLFLSGRGGPTPGRPEKYRHLLPKKEFIDELIKLGGISKEVAASKEILDFTEPIIRVDFQAVETYEYQPSEPVNIPISVLIGKEESTSLKSAMSWQKQTLNKVKVAQFPGDHFFIFNQVSEICTMISNTLYKSNSPRLAN